MKNLIAASLLFSFAAVSQAHFGSVIPDKQIVEDQKDSTVTLAAAFNHPMEQSGMNMAKPKNLSVIVDGRKTDLTDTLKPAKVLDKDAWSTQYKVIRPGLYEFVLEPQP